MSEIDTASVHHGIWTDVSRGSTMGNTITTDTRTGNIIVALMTVLCSMATAHLWHLITFAIHQYRADGESSDALYRQQQAILRTFPTPSAVLTEFTKLYFSWRPSRSHSPGRRLAPLAFFAALFTGAGTVAGIFSSYIVDSSNIVVLTQSNLCGPFDFSLDNAATGMGDNYTQAVYALAEPLVQDCYGDTVSASPRCRVYLKPRIPFNVSRESCLWDPSLCLKMKNPTVVMDSGLMNMNDVFGLNLAKRDQVMFRRKTSCAILPLENHTSTIAAADFPPWPRDPLPGEEVLIFNYGTFSGNYTWNNVTFAMSKTINSITSNGFGTRCAAKFVFARVC